METINIPQYDLIIPGSVGGVNYTTGIIIAVFILFYLIYTLVKPEEF